MKPDRKGSFILPVLISGTIALTIMGVCHQASCATTLRVKDALERTQLTLLTESGRRLVRGGGLTVGLQASGQDWSLEVSAGPGARVVARAGLHQHAE